MDKKNSCQELMRSERYIFHNEIFITLYLFMTMPTKNIRIIPLEKLINSKPLIMTKNLTPGNHRISKNF